MAMTFLVVLAGSVVRMTGSGMGCPDWPKCFGLMIPPTEASEVTWQEGETYDRGRMLLKRDTLWVAQSDLHSTDFEAERVTRQWVAYDKHDYAVFNPLHTWVEFINRLLGALTGIPALLLLGWTFWRGVKVRHWKPFTWAIVHLFWLGRSLGWVKRWWMATSFPSPSPSICSAPWPFWSAWLGCSIQFGNTKYAWNFSLAARDGARWLWS